MSTSRGARGGLAVTTAVLAGAALVALGVVAGLLAAPEPVPATARPAVADGPFAVSVQPYDDARVVPATPELSEAGAVSVTGTGTLTRSLCAPGAVFESGTSPVTLDDRALLALATGVPPWRDLASGARGEDVTALQTELARLGYSVDADGHYGAATRSAVATVQRDVLGMTRPSGSLTRASVLWLPAPSVTVATCEHRLGDEVTGVLATTAGALDALRVTVPDRATPGDRLVRFAGHTAPVEDGLVTDPEFLATLGASAEFRYAQEASQPLTLDYVLAEPLAVAVVPPGSVFALSGDAGCVVAGGEARPVTVVASSLGQTYVTFTGEAPASVELTPQAAGRTCP